MSTSNCIAELTSGKPANKLRDNLSRGFLNCSDASSKGTSNIDWTFILANPLPSCKSLDGRSSSGSPFPSNPDLN